MTKEECFNRFFRQTMTFKFTTDELMEEDAHLKAYRDWYRVTKTSFDKGLAHGFEESGTLKA